MASSPFFHPYPSQPNHNTAARVSLLTCQVIFRLKTNLRYYCSSPPSLGCSDNSLLTGVHSTSVLLHTCYSLCLQCFAPSSLQGSHPLLPSALCSCHLLSKIFPDHPIRNDIPSPILWHSCLSFVDLF